MSLSIGAISAKASYDDGNWCGTKPGPRPHVDLGSLTHILGGGMSVDGDERCGNGIRKLHLPPPPPPLGEAAGALSHLVSRALGL